MMFESIKIQINQIEIIFFIVILLKLILIKKLYQLRNNTNALDIMKQKAYTARGLKYLTITFFTLIVYTLVSIAFFLYWQITTIVLPYHIIFILMSLAIITFFIGTYILWKGRNEITEKHINNVENGLWLIIIFLAITTMFGIFLDKTITNNLSYFMMNLMIMLVSFYFLKNISNKRIRYIIWIAIFMFVILNPLITIVTYYFQYDYYVNLYRLVLQIFSLIIPYVLFTFCYYKTYKDTQNKNLNKHTS